MTNRSVFLLKLMPVLLCFFAMGFVDLVGIATNYVKMDFRLSDTLANIFPSLVFFWFFVFSVPTGLMMNKIGRRKTVLVSLLITLTALVLPALSYSLVMVLISFCLLGIGNAVMQVSLNPLISNLVGSHKLSSVLTFGQFVKAIASFMAPIIAGWFALYYQNWRLMFWLFASVTLLALVTLWQDDIAEKESPNPSAGFVDTVKLLKNNVVLLLFVGIMCHAGIDIGTNVTAPKVIMEKLGQSLSVAGYATSIYFLFRTIGSFMGSFILAKVRNDLFFLFSALLIGAGILLMIVGETEWVLLAGVACIGFGNANIFPVIFAHGLMYLPNKQNEMSALMIMGLMGGTVFPLFMGMASDSLQSQTAAVAVMGIGMIYLAALTGTIKQTTH